MNVDNTDRFFRLQKMRETLDEGIDWQKIKDGIRPMNSGEKILFELRDSVDEALKVTPGKKEADMVYQMMKNIEDDLLSKTELKGGIDKYKLARLLNNTDSSSRFKDNLSRLKDWAADEQFDADAREMAKKFIAGFEEAAGQQKLKSQLSSFRSKQGPSSPAIEKLGSQLNKNTLVQDAIRNPASFVNSSDQFFKDYAGDIVGKTWKQMNEAEKSAFIKVWVKTQAEQKKNGLVTPEAMKDWYQRFLK